MKNLFIVRIFLYISRLQHHWLLRILLCPLPTPMIRTLAVLRQASAHTKLMFPHFLLLITFTSCIPQPLPLSQCFLPQRTTCQIFLLNLLLLIHSIVIVHMHLIHACNIQCHNFFISCISIIFFYYENGCSIPTSQKRTSGSLTSHATRTHYFFHKYGSMSYSPWMGNSLHICIFTWTTIIF